MMKNNAVKIIVAGLVGGFIGNGVLGALFSSPPVHSVLYNSEWQSQLFIDMILRRSETYPYPLRALSC